MPVDPNRRFQIAYDKSRAEWAAADPLRAAARAGGLPVEGGVRVPFFGGPHLVAHPGGEVVFEPTGRPAHISVAIVLLHYLLTADGTAAAAPATAADSWIAFRDLPNGLFYSQAFAAHAETPLAARFGADLEAFRAAARSLGGTPLPEVADASFRFQALPRLPVAALLWEGDEEFPARARILFDANAGHYLPTEDLSGLGDWLAHRLLR